MRIFVSHASSFNYTEELYQPLRLSSFNDKHEIFLPHENGDPTQSQRQIQDSDLMLAEVSYPSTGQGIEIGWAHAAGIPILCISRKGSTPSKSLKFITNHFLEYENAQNLVSSIEPYLKSHFPSLL